MTIAVLAAPGVTWQLSAWQRTANRISRVLVNSREVVSSRESAPALLCVHISRHTVSLARMIWDVMCFRTVENAVSESKYKLFL